MRTRVLAFLVIGIFFVVCVPFSLEAQEDVVTVMSVVGDVTLSVQEGTAMPAGGGETLIEGDSLRTRDLSNAAVEFSDLSAVELEENTSVTVSVVAADPATGATRSQLNLWWGNLRSLMPGDIPDGSSIMIETVNAVTEIGGVDDPDFEGADAQINYDPTEDTTIAVAHKFDVVMTNLLTEESIMVPEGSIGIVQGSTIETMDLTIFFPPGNASLMEIIETQGEGEYTVKAQLDRVALVIKQLQIQQLTIEGHTDNVGKESANKQLAQRRADNVKKYFVEFHSLAPSLFQTLSYGEENPLDNNATEEGRARNRRVEVHY
jgi:outer membrane protein OmpA-like peptidoglycan-associated protein